MPFVTQEHRDKPDLSIAGDRCFIYYDYLVSEWNKEPRWTTADRLHKKMQFEDMARPLSQDMLTAMQLAWQVFFQLKIMPYELEKRDTNGDI